MRPAPAAGGHQVDPAQRPTHPALDQLVVPGPAAHPQVHRAGAPVREGTAGGAPTPEHHGRERGKGQVGHQDGVHRLSIGGNGALARNEGPGGLRRSGRR